MKKPFKFFLFIISFCLLTNCNTYRESQQSLLSDQLTLTYAKKMHEEYGLYLFLHHPSISPVTNKIERLNINFASNAKANIDQARKMLFPCIEKFIKEINNDQKIRSYLKRYPFSIEDILIGINFFDNNGNFISDGSVAKVSLVNGEILYKKNNPITDHFEPLYRETFEEAQKIVNSQR